MSLGVILSEDGGITEMRIVPSKVIPTQRLTFDGVDELILSGRLQEQEPQLYAVYQVQISTLAATLCVTYFWHFLGFQSYWFCR